MFKNLLATTIGFTLLSSCQLSQPARNPSQEKSTNITANDPRIENMDMKLVQDIADLFKGAMTQRHGTSDSPKKFMGSANVQRAVFLKTHGCAKGTFEVPANLDPILKVGLFSSAFKRTAYVRLSSDTPPDTADQKNSTVGLSIKILDVPGKKILPGEEEFKTHDFLLQNHPVFFVNNLPDFLSLFSDPPSEITNQPGGDALLAKYQHILDVDMPKEVKNVMASNYWSTTTYQFGVGRIAKYKVAPCSKGTLTKSNDPNYLATLMKKDFAAKGGCFDFQVQVRPDDQTGKALTEMATADWDEKVFKPMTVGRITIQPQDISANALKCENMEFTAWHALPDHMPLGSINKGRGIIYKMLGDYRHQRNGIQLQDVTE
jgi:hypothetical protein